MILHPRLIATVGDLLDGPVRPYDFRWPRLARPGEGCGYHCDRPYMSQAAPTVTSRCGRPSPTFALTKAG